eukprot:3284119-Alexandrium_andersonii.AAC.2
MGPGPLWSQAPPEALLAAPSGHLRGRAALTVGAHRVDRHRARGLPFVARFCRLRLERPPATALSVDWRRCCGRLSAVGGRPPRCRSAPCGAAPRGPEVCVWWGAGGRLWRRQAFAPSGFLQGRAVLTSVVHGELPPPWFAMLSP